MTERVLMSQIVQLFPTPFTIFTIEINHAKEQQSKVLCGLGQILCFCVTRPPEKFGGVADRVSAPKILNPVLVDHSVGPDLQLNQ